MRVDRSYMLRNDASRERLKALAARLRDDDLRRELENGWTIAVGLAHVAFWDRRSLGVLESWEREGVKPSPIDADAINAAMLPHWQAMPPREVLQEVVAAAEQIDGKIATLDGELIQAILDAQRPRVLDRSQHRTEHLDQIERALARS